MAKPKRDSEAAQSQVTKKCPQCYTYMSLNDRRCPYCKIRVGRVDKHGMATKGTDWASYIICILAWLTLAVYVWVAFFRS